jgi:hypothetical protein
MEKQGLYTVTETDSRESSEMVIPLAEESITATTEIYMMANGRKRGSMESFRWLKVMAGGTSRSTRMERWRSLY